MDWIDVFEQTPLLLYAVSILVGLIVGSFLNVVILRLPRMLEDEWARDCAELSGTPGAAGYVENAYPIKIHVRTPWEDAS